MDLNDVNAILNKLKKSKDKYIAGGPRKWFVLAGGIILGFLLGTTVPTTI